MVDNGDLLDMLLILLLGVIFLPESEETEEFDTLVRSELLFEHDGDK